MITGVILAGGQATRMGGKDKGLMELDGKPLYQLVLSRLAPQVDKIIINANRNQVIYQQSGYPVVNDINKNYAGPLAGVLTGLVTVKTEWVIFVPCDVPALPLDLVSRLWQGRGDKKAAYATDGNRAHPTLLLIHTNLASALDEYLAKGDRKLMLFLNEIDAQSVSFSDQPQAFRNFNTTDDLQLWHKDRYDI
ncbi:molybdenum cofactor guanylyltransferase MobA [Prodigiosinella aquatilis]|nr:molybdenum cofactor guanylyltransferase MobA [Prodigiosinella sp. LS101]WJV53936.1 molybdenum cofactor guanylyltransferase MobA [Prodigiosinella sp. LS101]WJV58298.1 molybdenum cofactor guanylyltransferase MobA [Pectobacteriaceae bacterium C111]